MFIVVNSLIYAMLLLALNYFEQWPAYALLLWSPLIALREFENEIARRDSINSRGISKHFMLVFIYLKTFKAFTEKPHFFYPS